jgi:4-oxalocrotonate tautomerase
MPIVEIKMWPGRSREQKQQLVKKLTETVVEVLGASPNSVRVLIFEVPQEHWAIGGKTSA